MLAFIGRRLLIAIPTVILISVFVFALQKLLPGDPVLVMAGEERDPRDIEPHADRDGPFGSRGRAAGGRHAEQPIEGPA